jgi:crotonobetainyl-CoA:carnitine CoA-transferase CaiB-like acyl-CoA transferase
VELATRISAPTAACLLGDMGADVIKVEPLGGDPARSMVRAYGVELTAGGENLAWENWNRNKRSITLDLDDVDGRRVMGLLLDRADVFVTNVRGQALLRLGLDPEGTLAGRPRLIYAIAEGLGHRGPRRDDPVVDLLGLAYSGFMRAAQGSSRSPSRPPGALADVLTGTMIAFGILAALVLRGQTGHGTVVRTSQLLSMMWLQNFDLFVTANCGKSFEPFDRRSASPHMNIYRCSDDKWLAAGLTVLDDSTALTQWGIFCRTIARPDLAELSRYQTSDRRYRHRRALIKELDDSFARRPRSFWLRKLRSAGIWVSAVNSLRDVAKDPHVRAEGYLMPTEAGLRVVRPPFELDDWTPTLRSAPDLGAASMEILGSLGLTDKEAASLRGKGVVG